MRDKEIIKKIMKAKGVKNTEISQALNITPQACWNRINRADSKTLTTGTLVQILNYLGYDLVIMPHKKAHKISDAYIVDIDKPKK